MKRIIATFSAVLIISGVILGRTRHEVSEANVPATLEQHIPFDIRVTSKPTRHCDPMDLNVIITTLADGTTEFRWQVMNGDQVQMEFSTFDELYYTCDGPGCFNIRTVETNKLTGITVTTSQKHICLK